MPRETFDAITESQIKKASIATLADRPNSVSRYGDSNLSAQELKERFDAFPYLVQKKINEIIDALASASASKYITLSDHSTGKDNLYDFIALFSRDASNGKSIADFIYALYTAEQAASPASKSISEIFNDMASRLAALESARVALQESVSNHETRISSNESGIANHETRISANESGIANHETRISGIEQYLGGDNFIVDDSIAYQKAVPKNACEKAKILSVGGMTYKSQNLIPFPYDKAAGYTETIDGITWTVNFDGTIMANGTATKDSIFIILSIGKLPLPKDIYTLSGSPSYKVSLILSAYKNGAYVREAGDTGAGETFDWTSLDYDKNGLFAIVPQGNTVSNLVIKPMLNYGTSALPYRPFFTGLRNAKVDELKSQGRNKFNPSEYIPVSNNTTLSDDVITATFTSGTLFINYERKIIYPAGTYTLLVQPVGGEISYAVHIYPKSDKNFTSKYVYYKKTGEEQRMVFTMDEDFALCFGGYENYGAFSFRVQLSSGENQFPYSRYEIIDRLSIPDIAQVSLGVGKTGTDLVFSDTLLIENGKKYRRDICEEISFNGTEDWVKYVDYTTANYFYLILEGKTVEEHAIIATHFDSAIISAGNFEKGIDIVRSQIDSKTRIIIRPSDPDMTIGDFKTMLADWNNKGDPLTIVFANKNWNVADVTDKFRENDEILMVEAGGTITAVNEHKLAAPSSIKYLVTYPKEV
jgi:hypothetical protein